METMIGHNSGSEHKLAALAFEINALDKQGKSVMVEIGKKLIEIRAELRLVNGENVRCQRGADGLYSPVGWEKWVEENLTTALSYARICMRCAIDPDGMRINYQKSRKRTSSADPDADIARVMKRWPKWTDEQKGRLAAFIRQEAQRELGI